MWCCNHAILVVINDSAGWKYIRKRHEIFTAVFNNRFPHGFTIVIFEGSAKK